METHSSPQRYRTADTALSRPIGDELVVLDLQGEQYFGLDRVGAAIWELLGEPRTIDDMVGALVDRFDVDRGIARSDTTALIDELLAAGLVQPA